MEANQKKRRVDTKKQAKNMKSNNITCSNREKLSIKCQANGQDS